MQIEIYLEDEIKDMIADVPQREEWEEACRSLGLEGQLSLAQPEKSVMPFTAMTTEQYRVYGLVCSDKVEIKSFVKEAIPLRVLSIAALCEREQYFERLEIWSEPSGLDPLLVGKITRSGPDDYYLLARWGKELVSYTELRAQAVANATKRARVGLMRTILEAQAKLDNLEAEVEAALGERWSSLPGI